MPDQTTVQREISPIPPGRYWINVVGDLAISDFAHWVRDMAGAVVVEHVEDQKPPGLNPSGLKRLAFVIFVVPLGRSPFLDGPRFGFPNFAPSNVRTSADVFGKDPLTPLDDGIIPFLDDKGLVPSFGSAALLLLLVALLTLGNKN